VSDRPDGLWPTVVVDESGRALGLTYSSLESLRLALESGQGVYHSRRRGAWVKGETSGDTQDLLRVDADCDRDTLRFTVRQHGRGFCHEGTAGCWGEARGLAALEGTIASRVAGQMHDAECPRHHAEGQTRGAGSGSYTRRLIQEEGLLEAKLAEEAGELGAARGADRVAEEAADLLYFTCVALTRAGTRLADVERVLDRRALQVTRRAGDRK
jgi:phosphoribosyl-ATP pyrophosphohydrolase